AVGGSRGLVRGFDGDRVPRAGVEFVVVVQTLEAEVDRRVRLRLLPAGAGGASAGAGREADRPVVRVRSLLALPAGREFVLGYGSVGRREVTRLRGARAADRNLPRIRHGARSEPHGEGGDGNERKPEPSKDGHSQVPPPLPKTRAAPKAPLMYSRVL